MMKVPSLSFIRRLFQQKAWISSVAMLFCLCFSAAAFDVVPGSMVHIMCKRNPFNPSKIEKVNIYEEPDAFSEILSTQCDFQAKVIEVVNHWVKIESKKRGIKGFVSLENISNAKQPASKHLRAVFPPTGTEELIPQESSKKIQTTENEQTDTNSNEWEKKPDALFPMGAGESIPQEENRKKKRNAEKKQSRHSSKSAHSVSRNAEKKASRNKCEELILKMSMGKKLSSKEQKMINSCF